MDHVVIVLELSGRLSDFWEAGPAVGLGETWDQDVLVDDDILRLIQVDKNLADGFVEGDLIFLLELL